jgi:hypothetical protein
MLKYGVFRNVVYILRLLITNRLYHNYEKTPALNHIIRIFDGLQFL